MAGVLVQPHLGIRPIRSTGDPGSQFPNCFFHIGDPGLTGVHTYGRKTTLPIPCCLLLGGDEAEGNVITEFFLVPQAFRLMREESSDWVMDMIWNCCNEGQMLRHP